MIQFAKLRLHGFKSFVDKTELEISTGLTGIIGPNGCGKSNLVEALRWSMGENSSKKMRGGSRSMDDVIFSGTARRPARNTAEVSVLIDNKARSAPPPFNNSDDVEISRKIERDQGSSYKINGRPVRAKDVQIFYADILSGSNSPYLVSQGKVTNMIQAKPLERRLLLEEAAGITGLYARRHEAELRLRATDNNLKRIEDLVGGMDSRLQALKKQARQAQRYRNLSAQIRQLEVMIAVLEWQSSHQKLQDIKRSFGEAESRVAEHLTVVTQLTKTQNTQSVDLPDLRQKEAEMSAALQTKKLALQRLEDEAQHLESQITEASAQLSQIITDRDHEQQTLKENSHILEKLEQEEKRLLDNQDNEDKVLNEKEQAKEALAAQVDDLETSYTALTEKTASDRAHKQSLQQQLENDIGRLAAVKDRIDAVQHKLEQKKENQKNIINSNKLKSELEKLDKETETLRLALETADQDYETASAQLEQQKDHRQEQEKEKLKIENEISALESVLSFSSENTSRPVLDDIITDSGFEIALSRALGDHLMASLDDRAPVSWQKRNIKDLPALPAAAKALKAHVKAPEALHLALSQIGFVEDDKQGLDLADKLLPGQSLVSRNGSYWRWDGLHIKESAADRHAIQLQQKNKLQELQKQLPGALKQFEDAQTALDKIAARKEELQTHRSQTQSKLYESEAELRQKRQLLNTMIEEQSAQRAELAKLEEALSLTEADLVLLEDTIRTNRASLEQFDDKALEEQQQKTEQARSELSTKREELHDAIRELELVKQDNRRSKARLRAIGDERINLQNRCIRAKERVKELDERETHLKAKQEEFKKRPALIKQDSASLLDKISDLESEKSAVSDKLAQCEAELGETTKALKQAEAELAEARESRAHAQATMAERQSHLDEVVRKIHEKFEMEPSALKTQAAMDEDKTGDLDELKAQRESNVRSRDMIGPVNLRADVEAEELEKELTGILNERNDLIEAIDELRQGIQKLNKEARERLQTTFDHINAHFQDVFTRLFKGGKAHLALIESDDPLEAGLEIFAEPPGKTLQSLSLLSGGEQTLTAVALIFAMFLTNPAPICVMDEVDAPLDDANVDRFCDMLEEFAEKGQTRFLIVTHHRLTMARMDRLYGVTMSERGVSQLVSVDMNQQFDFLDEEAA